MLLGLTLSCPATVLPPVPDKDMDRDGFDALEVMDTLPLALPAEAGEKMILKVLF